jgi:hypothetical protein
MNLSNGRCNLCQIRDNDETMQHLFFKCPSVNKIIKEIEAILVTLIFFNFVQICVQSILPPYCSSHLTFWFYILLKDSLNKCPSVNKIIKEIEAIFNRSGLTANIEIKEYFDFL